MNIKFLKVKPVQIVLWSFISLLGAFGWGLLATARGESINTIWFLVAGICTYIVCYRFYAKHIVNKILKVSEKNATPAHELNDSHNYTPTPKATLFGHHFASIAGAGPLVGPVLASQMGYLPSTMWIIFGAVFAGAVQDMITLFFSTRNKGQSLGLMAEKYLGKFAGKLMSLIIFIMTLIVLAVVALICVNAMAESSWAVFSISCTIPIALFMGLYLRYLRPGKVTEISFIGFALLIFAVFAGQWVSTSSFSEFFHLSGVQLVWYIIIYCFLVAILPVWLLLVPKDYLSTFMKVGTIVVLAVAIVIVQPLTQVASFTNFAFNSDGPAFAGSLFPFLFITIACGALSGFHSTISSGTTPKMIDKETDIRAIGYGSMLLESFVALMALVAAVSLNSGVFFAMNMPAATIEKTAGTEFSKTVSSEENATAAVRKLNVNGDNLGVEPTWFEYSEDGSTKQIYGAKALEEIAKDMGEHSVVSRTGGAPTLAVSMANILHNLPVVGGKNMLAFWYHFAVMFEALFILSVVSAGTITLRNQVKELLLSINTNRLNFFRRKDTILSSAILSLPVIALWGFLLMIGVTDPNGGIRIMYPLFGVANQLIAVVALALCTVILTKERGIKRALVTFVPLVWVSIVTFVASFEKIFSSDPNLGYFKMFFDAKAKLSNAASSGLSEKTVEVLQTTARNTLIQGSLSVLFIVLVSVFLVVCIRATLKIVKAK